MIKKHLTCRTWTTSYGERVVARLDPDIEFKNVEGISISKNAFYTEPGEIAIDSLGSKRKVTPDRHYLIGEIADTLYEYEQLGYTPEELKEMIDRLKVYEARDSAQKMILITTGRQNGKTTLQRAMYEYMMNDVDITRQLCEWHKHNPYICNLNEFEIEKVIFNDPATIVFWSDGTKTVVKTQNGEKFDPEKGLAMTIAKKAFGNKGNYYNHIKKWTDKYREERTVKTDELCTRCKWSFTGDECKSHRHCTDCGHRDKYGRCLCLTVRSFDACPYFEEATAE